MAYANVRSLTIDHTKIPNTDQSNLPVVFTCRADTLNGAINNSVTSVTVTAGKQVQNGDYIRIDSEIMLVGSGGGTTSLTVTRAQLSTSAASHSDLAVVTNCFLSSAANGGGVTSASGFDIIFSTASDGSAPIAYERVVWDVTQGMTEAWLLIASASHTVDTVLYVLWGDSGVTTDQSAPATVWASYKCVNHMPDGATLSVADSTGNNTPVNHSVTAGAGEIDGGGVFNGSSGYVDDTNAVSNFTGSVTMEAWVNPSSTATAVIMGNQTATDGYQMFVAVGGFMAIYCLFANYISGGVFSTSPAASVLPTGTWSHVVAVNDAGTMRLYINGALQTLQLPSGAGAIGASTNPFLVGKQVGGFNFGGSIDESRLSSTARSGDFIGAEYNSQFAPNTFYGLGVTGGPPVTGIVPQIMYNRRMQHAA